jgi:hypothetical protein
MPIETAPKDGTAILAWIGLEDDPTGFPQNVSYRNGWWWDMGDYGYSDCVTHWMPLPCSPHAPRQIEEERSDDTAIAEQ